MLTDVKEQRNWLIKFVRATNYSCLGILVLVSLLVIYLCQEFAGFKSAPAAALVVAVLAWLVVFISEYYVFLLKNYRNETITHIYKTLIKKIPY
ncbi:MAG: hypothetical protein L0G96_15085 [Acinetobacter sp.]|nr:hypothetical protein [Acinetobacter sp.]